MSKFRSNLLACAALAGLGLGHAATPLQAAPGMASQRIAVPFAPPTGETLRYRLRVTKDEEESVLIQTLNFQRDGDGYLMRVATTGVEQDNRVKRLPLPVSAPGGAELRLMSQAMLVELDASGAMLRLRNWAELRRHFAALPAQLAAEAEIDPARRREAQAFFTAMMQGVLQASAEQAPQMFLRGWPAVLGFGGSALAPGEKRQWDDTAIAPIVDAPVIRHSTMMLRRAPGGRVVLYRVAKVDRANFVALANGLTAKLGSLASDDERARMQDTMKEIEGLEVEDFDEIEVDGVTGLIERADLNRRVMRDGAAIAATRTTLERLR